MTRIKKSINDCHKFESPKPFQKTASGQPPPQIQFVDVLHFTVLVLQRALFPGPDHIRPDERDGSGESFSGPSSLPLKPQSVQLPSGNTGNNSVYNDNAASSSVQSPDTAGSEKSEVFSSDQPAFLQQYGEILHRCRIVCCFYTRSGN